MSWRGLTFWPWAGCHPYALPPSCAPPASAPSPWLNQLPHLASRRPPPHHASCRPPHLASCSSPHLASRPPPHPCLLHHPSHHTNPQTVPNQERLLHPFHPPPGQHPLPHPSCESSLSVLIWPRLALCTLSFSSKFCCCAALALLWRLSVRCAGCN